MIDGVLDGDWIDVTRPLAAETCRWPGDPSVELSRFSDMRKGDVSNVSKLTLCTHSGTHIDAPLHFIAEGAATETAPLNVLMGTARVIEIHDPVSIRRAELEKHSIQAGERILFKTQNAKLPWDGDFRMDFVYIAADGASYLAEKRVAFIGVDGMSVGGFYQDMVETHVALLGAGIWIAESLDLRLVQPGLWDMICLPLKLVGGDGAPARIVLRKQ